MAEIIDGKKISQELKDDVKAEVEALKKEGIEPSLAVILVGQDPASTVYVNNKKKACEYTGIKSLSYELPETTSEEELLELIEHAVVVGRSNIVGKPMAMLLLRENATVTVCHSHTPDLRAITKQADILVVAIGQPKFIDGSYIKEGATVIDVGIHRLEGKKLCGDVDYESAEKVAGKITPVPGGVGPMTIAELMNNCKEAAEMHAGRR